MHIQILFFAVFRERLRSEGERMDLPAGATVAVAQAEIAQRHPEVAGLLGRVKVAVNRAFAEPGQVLRDGDELAFIPPVAGGAQEPGDLGRPNATVRPSEPGASRRNIAVLATPLSLDDVVAAVAGEAQGGIVTFTGVVRRQGQQPNVARLEYEAYVPMAEAMLAAIVAEIEARLPGTRLAIHHRTGTLRVGDIAVVIAASAPHRDAAFDACRAAIEELKSRAPIWKKEIGDDGAEWIGLGP